MAIKQHNALDGTDLHYSRLRQNAGDPNGVISATIAGEGLYDTANNIEYRSNGVGTVWTPVQSWRESKFATKTGNYNVVPATDAFLFADVSASSFAFQLPDAAANSGLEVGFKVMGTPTANTLTINAYSTQKIDDSSSLVLYYGETVYLKSNGTNWYIK